MMSQFVALVITFALRLKYVGCEWQQFHWFLNSSGLDYSMNYCRRVCDLTEEIDVLAWDPICSPCSCIETCPIYGNCCPEFAPTWSQSLFDQVDKLYETRSESQVGRGEIPMDQYKYFDCVFLNDDRAQLVVTKCPKSELNQTLAQLCSQNVTQTVVGYTPVSHAGTGVTYRNIHCHKCTGKFFNESMILHDVDTYNHYHKDPAVSPASKDDDIIPWSVNISCQHYQTLYHLTSEDEFLQQAQRQSFVCTVTLKDPDNIPAPQECLPHWYSDTRYSQYTSCSHPDPRLLHYCLHIRHPAFRTNYREGYNLFCALCDGYIPQKNYKDKGFSPPPPTVRTSVFASTFAPTGRPRPPPPPPLSLLLGIRTRYGSGTVTPKCSNIKWRNDQGDCVPANCSSGKLPHANSTCSSVLTQIRGLGYRLALVFLPEQENVTVTRYSSQIVVEYFNDMLIEMISDEYEFQVSMIVRAPPSDTGDGEILRQLSLDAYIIGSTLQPRDAFETEMLDFIQGNWSIILTDAGMAAVTLKLQTIGVEFLSYQNEQTTPVTVDLRPSTYAPWHTRHGFFSTETTPPTTTPVGSQINNIDIAGSWMKQYTIKHRSAKQDRKLWTVTDLFIDVTHSLVCPYVVKNVTDIAMVDDKIILTFEHNGKLINVTGGQDVSLVDGKIRLCLKLFKKLTRSAWRKSHDPLAEAQHYFEVVCVCISVACLLMSFITYSLFPTLRSLPGLNNMSLCISLALAQTLLVVTVRHGVRGHLSTGHCFFHGLVLHYAWLSAITWMSMCCVHMYRVFTCKSNKFINPSSDRKRYLHYCVLAFGIPVLIVILTVALNAALTSGPTYGYDDEICFLDTRTSLLTIILSLFVPLCVMIVINSVLFFITIREIAYVTSLQENTREPQLSTLTGIFCIVCVVAVQLDNPVLSFFTSPLMALQGAFIFFSFTVNRRIGKLYCDLVGCQAPRWLERPSAADSNQKMVSTSNEGQKHTNSSTETSHI